ncbi:MAG: hypothetical protein IKI08_04730 [Selenomonadaceae bacterium]|nr:hypothetical protein [Selenomonadaceae bacterium]
MIISPSGANKFIVRGFKSKQSLNNHWRDHGEQYPEFTLLQYEQRALELIESPVGGNILGHVDKVGVLIRYDKVTNDFVKGRPIKGIFTMFKPDDGLNYYETRKKEDIEHGGCE